MRQEKEWSVRQRRDGGGLSVFMESLARSTDWQEIVSFLPAGLYHLYWSDRGRWMWGAHRLKQFYYHTSPIVWGCLLVRWATVRISVRLLLLTADHLLIPFDIYRAQGRLSLATHPVCCVNKAKMWKTKRRDLSDAFQWSSEVTINLF